MQQDNDPKHRAHIVIHCLKEKEVELLKWPPFSPHRAYVGRGGKKNEKREAEERNRTEKIFTFGFGTDVTKKLVDSVPNRLNEIIRMNGYLTRY